jgi:hypothetical protein
MSTHIGDFAAGVAVLQAVAPSEQTAAFNGDQIDMTSGDGDCFAIQQFGTFTDGSTWTGRIEESADGTSWAAISGAAFDPVSEGDDTQVIRFARTARYLRYAVSITGSGPDATLAVLIGEQRKTF